MHLGRALREELGARLDLGDAEQSAELSEMEAFICEENMNSEMAIVVTSCMMLRDLTMSSLMGNTGLSSALVS